MDDEEYAYAVSSKFYDNGKVKIFEAGNSSDRDLLYMQDKQMVKSETC